MSLALLHRIGRAGWTLLALAAVSAAHAAGLGTIQVQSALGEPLRVSVALLGNDAGVHEAACVKARITSLDGTLVIRPAVHLTRSGITHAILLTSHEALNEPALNIAVAIACGTAVQREYLILLDPVVAQDSPAATTGTLPASTADHHARAAKTRADDAPPRHRQALHKSAQPQAAMASNRAEAENPGTRSVLKMSRTLGETDRPLAITRLQTADVQTTILKERDETIDESAVRDTGMVALIQALHDDTRALRAETARMQQQYARDRNEIASMRRESQLWIRCLLGLLLVCAAVIAWLLWRVYAMKKNAAHVSWNELFSDTASTTQQGLPTEFATTAFQVNSIDTSESGVAETIETADDGVSSLPEALILATADDLMPAHRETRHEEARKEVSGRGHGKPFKYHSGGAIPYVYSNQAERVDTQAVPAHALKTEEIAGVMELAEMWMAMHDPAAVEKLLEPFNHADPAQSPLPLLCLLDVYRALDKRSKHDAIAKRIKAVFNVNPAAWNPDSVPSRTLADYPHVREQVLALWESGEAAAYLDSLVLDNRNGLREGFGLPAYRDILRLKDIASRRPPDSRSGPAMEPEAYAILFAEEHRTDLPEPTAIAPSLQKMESSESETAVISKASAFAMREDMSPMSIKLHLALAYKEIGDREGAFLLLEEVIQDGNEEQRVQARQRIATLSAAKDAPMDAADLQDQVVLRRA